MRPLGNDRVAVTGFAWRLPFGLHLAVATGAMAAPEYELVVLDEDFNLLLRHPTGPEQECAFSAALAAALPRTGSGFWFVETRVDGVRLKSPLEPLLFSRP